MKVLVTGSRDWDDEAAIRRALVDSHATIVVHGDNRAGADAIAKRIATQLGLEVRSYPARWNRYGLSAGPKRNQEMLDKEHKPLLGDVIDVVLAFPWVRSFGTWDMMDRAEAVGLEVRNLGVPR